MEINTKKSINDNLKKYCYLAQENDIVEVTEWTNREGYDICIKDKQLSLTHGELEAINYLTQTLMYNK